MLNPGDWKRIPITVFRTAPRNSTEKSLAAKIEFTRNLLRCRAAEGLHPDASARTAGTETRWIHVRRRGKWKENRKGDIGEKLWLELSIEEPQPVDSFLRDFVRSPNIVSSPFDSCLSRVSRIKLGERVRLLRVDFTPDRQMNLPQLPQSYGRRYCCWSIEEKSGDLFFRKRIIVS